MAKLYATVNAGKEPLVLERATPNAPWSLPRNAGADLVKSGPGQYSLVVNGRSHRVLVLKEDHGEQDRSHAHRRAHLHRAARG